MNDTVGTSEEKLMGEMPVEAAVETAPASGPSLLDQVGAIRGAAFETLQRAVSLRDASVLGVNAAKENLAAAKEIRTARQASIVSACAVAVETGVPVEDVAKAAGVGVGTIRAWGKTEA